MYILYVLALCITLILAFRIYVSCVNMVGRRQHNRSVDGYNKYCNTVLAIMTNGTKGYNEYYISIIPDKCVIKHMTHDVVADRKDKTIVIMSPLIDGVKYSLHVDLDTYKRIDMDDILAANVMISSYANIYKFDVGYNTSYMSMDECYDIVWKLHNIYYARS